MITKSNIDGGHAFDWGKTSAEYAVYRPGYPPSFYTILQAVGIGRPGQHILDLGTGTGVLARAFAHQGAHVIGLDIAEAQIQAAQQLAAQEHLDIVSDHRGSNSQVIDFESVKIYPIFTVKIENPGKSNT